MSNQELQDTVKANIIIPKYMHLPGAMGYLYGEDSLVEKTVFIVEGIFDRSSLVQAGYASVALVGTNLKDEFISKFSRCETVILWLDGDEAGKKAVIQIGKKLGTKAKVLFSPKGEDPDEYVKNHSQEEIEVFVNGAVNFLTYQIELIDLNTPKLELPKALDSILHQLAALSKVYLEGYLDQIKSRFSYLRKEDIDGYRDLISSYKKEQKNNDEKNENIENDKQDKKVKETVFYRDDNAIYEEIYDPSKNPPTQFAKLSFENQKYGYVPTFEAEGKFFVPDESEDIWKKNVHLPSAVEFVSEDDLNREIEIFIQDNYWLSPKALFLCRCYIKYTWIYDLFSVVPYLRSIGQPGTGKTRWAQTVGILCNRPMFIAGGITESALYRSIDMHNPTIIINEFDTLGSDDRSRYTTILNNGYQKGLPIRLTEGEGDNRRPKSYQVYCPKIFTALESFESSALESRIITLPSDEFPTDLRNNYSVDLTEAQIERATSIRNKLLGYRFRYIANNMRAPSRGTMIANDGNDSQNQDYASQASQFKKDGSAEDPIFDKLRKVCGDILPPFPREAWSFFEENELESRTRQTFYRLLYVMSDSNEIATFISYVKQHQKELVKKRSDDLEGRLAKIILNKRETYCEDINQKGIGHLSVAEITTQVNNEDPNSKPIKGQKIGYVLRRLGISTSEKDHSNKKYLALTQKNILFMYERYIPKDSSLQGEKEEWIARLAQVQTGELVDIPNHESDSQIDSQITRVDDSKEVKPDTSTQNESETQVTFDPKSSWAQYFPSIPIKKYSQGQLESASQILFQFKEPLIKALKNNEVAYQFLVEKVTNEMERRQKQ